MTMGRFRVAPREGHLQRLKHVMGYLKNKKFVDAALRFRTEMPDYNHIAKPSVDWTYSVYGDVKEQIP